MITIKGLQEFRNRLSNSEFNDAIKRALTRSVILLQRNTMIETPVDTGLLRRSYRTEVDRLEARLINFRDYGVYVNARNPFIKRGMERSFDRIRDIFQEDLNDALQALTSKY